MDKFIKIDSFKNGVNPVNAIDYFRWDVAQHLKDSRMCGAFLSVAEDRYPDLILKVRNEIARAMSGWLVLNGHRAEVRWSPKLDCFVGRINPLSENSVYFKGETPAEVQTAFAAAVREMLENETPEAFIGETCDVADEGGATLPDYPAVAALEASEDCEHCLVPEASSHRLIQLRFPGTYPFLLIAGKPD